MTSQGPSSSASAAFLSTLEGALVSLLVEEWLAWLRAPQLIEANVRASPQTGQLNPGVGILVLFTNDLVRFIGNDVIHRSRLRSRMRRSAIDAGIPAGTARRFVRIFDAAYAEATRFSTDVDHQRTAVRRALGL